MLGYVTVAERIMMIKFNGKPFKYNIIQVYMPTSDHVDDEVEGIYKQVKQLMRKRKNEEITIIMGDFNAKVGCERDLTVGLFVLA